MMVVMVTTIKLEQVMPGRDQSPSEVPRVFRPRTVGMSIHAEHFQEIHCASPLCVDY